MEAFQWSEKKQSFDPKLLCIILFTLFKSLYSYFPASHPSWLAKYREEKQPILLIAEPNFKPLWSVWHKFLYRSSLKKTVCIVYIETSATIYQMKQQLYIIGKFVLY